MKIIKQSAQLLDTTNMTQYQVIEKVGRTCYKSEDKITDDSATKFVASLVKSGHHAMIEFGFVRLIITDSEFSEWFEENHSPYIRQIGDFVIGSFRAFYDWYDELLKGVWAPLSNIKMFSIIMKLLKVLSDTYPEVFKSLFEDIQKHYNVPESNEPYLFRICVNEKEFIDTADDTGMFPHLMMKIVPHTMLFTTDRGVTHELARHRPCSFAMESTRYCNYGKDKFGGELTVIAPCFANTGDTGSIRARNLIWELGMEEAEKNYLRLLQFGATPEQARDVLPHAVKADIWMCAFEDEWQHILDLRYHEKTGKAHPKMKELMGIAYPQLAAASNGRLLTIQQEGRE